MIEYDTVESIQQSLPNWDEATMDVKDTWDLWWEEKDELNQKLTEAIVKKDLKTI